MPRTCFCSGHTERTRTAMRPNHSSWLYCAAHANQLLGLEVKTSLLLSEPGEAGLGLFTTRDRQAGTVVDEYLGEVVAIDNFNAQPSPYAVSISQGRVVNSAHSSDCFARFANDARGVFRGQQLLVGLRPAVWIELGSASIYERKWRPGVADHQLCCAEQARSCWLSMADSIGVHQAWCSARGQRKSSYSLHNRLLEYVPPAS